MSFLGKILRSAIIGIALVAGSSYASAQEISESHLAASLDAIKSARGTRDFDSELPRLAATVTDRLIRQRPDLYKQIGATVESAALKLAARRKDLDNDIARLWAKRFTEDELKTIAAFYKSPAGKKFFEVGGPLAGETYDALARWSDRVGEELLDKAKQDMKAQGVPLQ